jgi:cell division protein FtsI (penicillin-binding protein 3)
VPASSDRLRRAAIGILIAIALLWVRAGYLTTVRHRALADKALKQQTDIKKIPSLRGPVLDRGGQPIAFSVEGSSLAVDPTLLGDPGALANWMEEHGIMPAAKVREQIRSTPSPRFAWLTRRGVREALACSLEARFGRGIIRTREPKRLYPLGPVAAPLLGATGVDGTGLFGLEGRYERLLRGTDGLVLDFRSCRPDLHRGPGRVVLAEPEIGSTVELTIDARFQQIVDARLREAVEEQNARGGTAILIDPKTGEVLAVSSFPGFDPDAVGQADSLALKVWAVTHNYEPGSTYKIVAFAAAIEAGVLRPDDPVNCYNGCRRVPGGEIGDHEGLGVVPATIVLAKSSNIGTGVVAEKVGGEGFFRMERLLGFGIPTGVEIPGEERGRIPDPSSWSARSLVTEAFGQEVSCTAMQLAMAYGAVANDGLLLRPYVVRSVRGPDGTVRESREPEIVRRAMRPQTARVLREMLRAVVTEGTGKPAEVKGLMPAGKTGTAQKYIRDLGRYSKEQYIASFVGFAPYDRPRWLCAVVIDEPRGSIWGGSVAAPVFARIMDDIAGLDRRPTDNPVNGIQWVVHESEPTTTVPRLVGTTPRIARKLLHRDKLEPNFVGRGDYVLKSIPAAGSRCGIGEMVTCVLSDPSDSLGVSGGIPDLMGLSLRDAMVRARAQDLELDLRGSGWVIAQDPPAGSPLEGSRTVFLELAADSCHAFVRMREDGR